MFAAASERRPCLDLLLDLPPPPLIPIEATPPSPGIDKKDLESPTPPTVALRLSLRGAPEAADPASPATPVVANDCLPCAAGCEPNEGTSSKRPKLGSSVCKSSDPAKDSPIALFAVALALEFEYRIYPSELVGRTTSANGLSALRSGFFAEIGCPRTETDPTGNAGRPLELGCNDGSDGNDATDARGGSPYSLDDYSSSLSLEPNASKGL